ncbi:MAG TPA: hypothetical protein VE964_14060 [Myxococcales bacterium]|nr:hypothetical protein [Myxococcales bacterium]
MIDTKIGSALAATVLAVTGFGCASANVKSNKSAEYSKKLERTMIVFPMDAEMSVYRQMLHEKLVGELQKRGVTSTFATLTGALDLKDATPIEQQAKDFKASTALFIKLTSGVVDQTGSIKNAHFDAQIFDLESKKRVWRASINYTAGGGFDTRSMKMDKLVGELVKALVNDGLVNRTEADARESAASPAPL